MKIEILDEAFSKARNAVARFPIAAIVSIVLTVLAIATVHDFTLNETVLPMMLAGSVGFMFLVGFKLFSEAKKINPIFGEVLGLALIGGLWFYFDSGYATGRLGEMTMSLQALMLLVVGFLFLLVAPYLRRAQKRTEEYFWTFVVDVVKAICIAFVYFGLLYLGIVLIYASVDYLFDVRVAEELYADTFFVIAGILASFFVMGSIPDKFSRFTNSTPFASGVTFLNKFIVVPLALVYLVVLYAYVGKIMIDGVWPEGGVAAWIVVFSVVGVLAYFVARFMKDNAKGYVAWFRKYFFWLLVPLTVVLYFAVGIRWMEYGMTVPRYLGLAMGDFFLLCSLYYIFSKQRGLRFMVILLGITGLISAVGPYSAVEWSYDSQVARIEALLERDMPLDDGDGIDEIVSYLVYDLDMRGKLVEDFGEEFVAEHEVFRFGFSSQSPWDYVYLYGEIDGVSVSGYDFMQAPVTFYEFEDDSFMLGENELLIDYDEDNGAFVFSMGEESVSWNLIADVEAEYGEELYEISKGDNVRYDLSFEFEMEKVKVKLVLYSFSYERYDDEVNGRYVFNGLDGYMFYSVK